jgi:hypothetical protein
MTTTPREAVRTLSDDPPLVGGDDERFNGYGAMGVPFASGHYLCLRDMLATSIGPPYRAIWHRDPAGHWTICTTIDPHLSCPRYFGRGAAVERVAAISIEWRDDWTVDVSMDDRLSWRLSLAASGATRLMTGMGAVTPEWAWNSEAVLASMGPMAGTVLGSGRIRLAGASPNGPRFRAAPLQLWRVAGGAAVLGDTDLGPLGPLEKQAAMADFWLPQKGIFFTGRMRFAAEQAAVQSRTGAPIMG